MGQQLRVHGKPATIILILHFKIFDTLPVTEASNTVQSSGDDSDVVVEGNDRKLGQEQRQQRVGFLLLTVGQRLGHCIPGEWMVRTELELCQFMISLVSYFLRFPNKT